MLLDSLRAFETISFILVFKFLVKLFVISSIELDQPQKQLSTIVSLQTLLLALVQSQAKECSYVFTHMVSSFIIFLLPAFPII